MMGEEERPGGPGFESPRAHHTVPTFLACYLCELFVGLLGFGVWCTDRLLAAVLYGSYTIRLERRAIPRPPSGWALIKTIAVGICGTDKAFYTGSYKPPKLPLVPGHEVVGIVVGGPYDLVGRVVVSEINFACGRCRYCRDGLYTHCPYRQTLGISFDGGMAEYFIAPISALHLADNLDPLIATQVEPLAALISMLRVARLEPRASIAILGSGNLALLSLQLLRVYGFEPTLIVRKDSPKIQYVEKLGAKYISVDEIVKEKQTFDVVVEVTGSPTGLELAIKLVKPRGKILAKSTHGKPCTIDITSLVVKEASIIGTRCGNWDDFELAIKLLEAGKVKPIITSTYTLHQAREAFERALQRDQVKVVVRVAEEV